MEKVRMVNVLVMNCGKMAEIGINLLRLTNYSSFVHIILLLSLLYSQSCISPNHPLLSTHSQQTNKSPIRSFEILLKQSIVLLLIFIAQINLQQLRRQFQIFFQPSIFRRIGGQLMPRHNKVVVPLIDYFCDLLVNLLLVGTVVAR